MRELFGAMNKKERTHNSCCAENGSLLFELYAFFRSLPVVVRNVSVPFRPAFRFQFTLVLSITCSAPMCRSFGEELLSEIYAILGTIAIIKTPLISTPCVSKWFFKFNKVATHCALVGAFQWILANWNYGKTGKIINLKIEIWIKYINIYVFLQLCNFSKIN